MWLITSESCLPVMKFMVVGHGSNHDFKLNTPLTHCQLALYMYQMYLNTIEVIHLIYSIQLGFNLPSQSKLL